MLLGDSSHLLHGPAQVVVVVSGLPYTDQDSAKKDEAVVTMVSQFDRTGAVVVAGGDDGALHDRRRREE